MASRWTRVVSRSAAGPATATSTRSAASTAASPSRCSTTPSAARCTALQRPASATGSSTYDPPDTPAPRRRVARRRVGDRVRGRRACRPRFVHRQRRAARHGARPRRAVEQPVVGAQRVRVVYAALLVPFGRLAERRSRDLGFLLGVLVFTVASAACAAAWSVTSLVVFRVLQAAGAALLTPTSLSLILATAPDERRQSSIRAWTALGGLAAALGPVVGGLLVTADWRWVFIVNAPIGLAALYVGWRRLPTVPGHPVPRPDALGAALLVAGVAGLTLALVEGGEWGWSSPAKLLHVAARLAFHARGARLRLQANWPWATDLAAAFTRLGALPPPA